MAGLGVMPIERRFRRGTSITALCAVVLFVVERCACCCVCWCCACWRVQARHPSVRPGQSGAHIPVLHAPRATSPRSENSSPQPTSTPCWLYGFTASVSDVSLLTVFSHRTTTLDGRACTMQPTRTTPQCWSICSPSNPKSTRPANTYEALPKTRPRITHQ